MSEPMRPGAGTPPGERGSEQDRDLVQAAAGLPSGKIEQKLFTVQYRHDKQSHIDISDRSVCSERCGNEWGRPCTAFCPAKVYEWNGEKIAISYENCVECTSCLLGCPYRVIDWQLPRGGFGVHNRFG